MIQAQKLGLFLADSNVAFTHIYSSDISRAFKTAGYIQAAQKTEPAVQVVQCKELREQDFGFFEGKSWKEDMAKLRAQRHNEPGFQDVETKQSLRKRAGDFLESHMMPLFASSSKCVVAVVSHGMLLSALWKELLSRQPSGSIKVAPEASGGRDVTLEHLPGWSNTGYLELEFSRPNAAADTSKSLVAATDDLAAASDDSKLSASNAMPKSSAPSSLEAHDTGQGTSSSVDTTTSPAPPFDLTILVVNGMAHLQGVKRVRGGIGSSKYDEKQTSISSFFSKRAKKS